MGTLGCRRHGKAHHLPAAGAVPLAPAAVVLGDCAAGGAGLRRPVPGAVPQSRPVVPARLCLRSGFTCFTQIARAMGFEVPDEADPNDRISLSYQEFLDAVAR